MAELLQAFDHDIDELVIVPSRGGVFEVDVDGTRVFSKAELGRHAHPGEIAAAVATALEQRPD